MHPTDHVPEAHHAFSARLPEYMFPGEYLGELPGSRLSIESKQAAHDWGLWLIAALVLAGLAAAWIGYTGLQATEMQLAMRSV